MTEAGRVNLDTVWIGIFVINVAIKKNKKAYFK